MSKSHDTLKLRGFARVQIVDRKTGLIQSDTGYIKNTIQKTGFEAMIVKQIIASAGGSIPSFLGLGNHTASINSTNFASFNTRAGTAALSNSMVSAFNSVVATANGATLRQTATFSGNVLLGTADANINAIGMFPSTTGTNSMLCGTTYTASSWSSDQDVKATYELRFSQT